MPSSDESKKCNCITVEHGHGDPCGQPLAKEKDKCGECNERNVKETMQAIPRDKMDSQQPAQSHYTQGNKQPPTGSSLL